MQVRGEDCNPDCFRQIRTRNGGGSDGCCSSLCKLTYKLSAVGQASNSTSLSWIRKEKLTMENQELEGRKLVFLFYSTVALDEAS